MIRARMASPWLTAACVALYSASFTGVAAAHYNSTALLQLREGAPGEFSVVFTPSTPMRRSIAPVRFRYPAHCHEQELRLRCGEPGLSGELTAEGLPAHGEVIVQVDWRDGSSVTHVLSSGRDRFAIAGTRGEHRLALVAAYLRLGVEHILAGMDHVLFVIGLVLIVGFSPRLIGTITAFTLAHSLSLALDVTGVVRLSPGPVEALIAASLVLVALEALSERDSATKRWPWSVAFVFGLVHGLGFGGALREVGLPAGDLGWALAGFNTGVELGQLALLGGLWLVHALVRRVPRPAFGWARTGAAYVVGGLGAFWFFDRALGLWPGSS